MMAANEAVRRAVRKGELAPPEVCEACASRGKRMAYHHWSYERAHWLDVIPLCSGCHNKVHAGSIMEPRTGRKLSRQPPRESLECIRPRSMSRKDVSSRCNINPRRLYEIERVRSAPRGREICTLVRLYGTSLARAMPIFNAHLLRGDANDGDLSAVLLTIMDMKDTDGAKIAAIRELLTLKESA